MQFLNPIFLIAGLCLAIPIIIHLFNFKKYKKVFFSDIRFLQEVKEQTNKRSKLKNILILLSRLLALSALVLAFAQPYFNKYNSQNKGNKFISIFIDNSYSMGLQKNNISLLELAKNKAKQIVNNSSNATTFEIVTNDFAPAENKIIAKDEALAAISNIGLSTQAQKVNAILQKQKAIALTSTQAQKEIILISDFQQNQFALPIKNDDVIKKYLIPIQTETPNNVSIDTAYFNVPTLNMNLPNELIVKIKNYNNTNSVNTRLTLTANKQVKTVKNISLKPNEILLEKITYTPSNAGWQNLQLHLTDFPVSFDDTFYMAGNVSATGNILIVNDGALNPYLNAVFKTGNTFKVENFNSNSISNTKFGNYSLVVINNVQNLSATIVQKLNEYISNGGNAIIFPSNNLSIENYNTALAPLIGININGIDTAKKTIANLNKDQEIIKDIFENIPENAELPYATRYLQISSSTFSAEQKLLSFADGSTFLSAFKLGAGNFYICASAVDTRSSNFCESYLFLPTLFKMAFIGANNPIHNYTLSKDALLLINNTKAGDNEVYHLQNETWDAIPQQRNFGNKLQINLNKAARFAGLYNLVLPNNTQAATHSVGLNYNRSESNLACYTLNNLKEKSNLKNATYITENQDLTTTMGQQVLGTPWWTYCIAFALLFLLLEILLVRMFK